jgi:hypothetical protein
MNHGQEQRRVKPAVRIARGKSWPQPHQSLAAWRQCPRRCHTGDVSSGAGSRHGSCEAGTAHNGLQPLKRSPLRLRVGCKHDATVIGICEPRPHITASGLGWSRATYWLRGKLMARPRLAPVIGTHPRRRLFWSRGCCTPRPHSSAWG